MGAWASRGQWAPGRAGASGRWGAPLKHRGTGRGGPAPPHARGTAQGGEGLPPGVWEMRGRCCCAAPGPWHQTTRRRPRPESRLWSTRRKRWASAWARECWSGWPSVRVRRPGVLGTVRCAWRGAGQGVSLCVSGVPDGPAAPPTQARGQRSGWASRPSPRLASRRQSTRRRRWGNAWASVCWSGWPSVRVRCHCVRQASRATPAQGLCAHRSTKRPVPTNCGPG